MSRLLVAFSLIATLTTTSFARPAPPTMFAKAPPAGDGLGAPVAPAELRIQPVLDRSRVRAKLAQNRAANLARFRAYQAKGIFPSNVYTAGALNVWRDQAGNYCAAATIIRRSGAIELVEQIAETDNFIKLADVTDGPLMDWMLTSGLTQAELALIQRPFMGVAPRPDLDAETIVAIDSARRAKETARLAKLYRTIEARLAKQSKASLDAAVDRLMRDDLALAYRLAYGS